jgi:hypothetical protein
LIALIAHKHRELDNRPPHRSKPLRSCHITGDPTQKSASRVILAGRAKSLGKKIAVSDRGSLRGLTQFRRLARLASVEPAECERDLRKRTRHTGVCDNLFEIVRNLLILKRRDAGAVDQARLESNSGERHRAMQRDSLSNRFNSFRGKHIRQRDAVNDSIPHRFQGHLTQFLHSSVFT